MSETSKKTQAFITWLSQQSTLRYIGEVKFPEPHLVPKILFYDNMFKYSCASFSDINRKATDTKRNAWLSSALARLDASATYFVTIDYISWHEIEILTAEQWLWDLWWADLIIDHSYKLSNHYITDVLIMTNNHDRVLGLCEGPEYHNNAYLLEYSPPNWNAIPH